MTKQIKIEDFQYEEVRRALSCVQIGRLQSIIVGRKKDGTELRKEYKKISDTHVEFVRNYEYS